MSEAFLLSRVLLQFNLISDDLRNELSAGILTPNGDLWVGSDELLTLERLSPSAPGIYSQHQSFPIADFLELENLKDEIDIEGMDYSDGYLWLTGSHSTKRKKPKGRTPEEDIQRLSEVKTDVNRYLLARIPIVKDTLFKSCPHPDHPQTQLSAARLPMTSAGNLLMEALQDDPHLSPFLAKGLPSKDNGFDIEGLAVRGDRVFLGLRGPVLDGWAMVIEIEVMERESGILTLKELDRPGQFYKKHWLDLHGLGVRELCLVGEDLLILAGPTMTLTGATRIYRLKTVLELKEESIFSRENHRLEFVFELPLTPEFDRAEGLTVFPYLVYQNSLLVLYDSPSPLRKIENNGVFTDVFRFP